MKINVMTSGFGSNKIGINKSNKNIINILNKNKLAYDNIVVEELEKYDQNTSLKNLKKTIEYNKKLAEKIYNDSESDFCLTIGGDHSISLGSISGLSKRYNNLGLIWIDAHGDMNTEKTSPTGNIHGMILASLQGIGHSKLVNFFYHGLKIKTENIVIFGTRDLDKDEELIMKKHNIRYYSSSEIIKLGLNNSIKDAINYIKEKTNKLHISIDLDVIDPLISPGVSVPVEGGFNLDELHFIITKLFDNFQVTSADIVEYNKYYDVEFKTIKILEENIKLIEKLVNKQQL